jgi:hypothetical protein
MWLVPKDRYKRDISCSAGVNYFKEVKQRCSVLASSNNINATGFSMDEILILACKEAETIRLRSNDGSFGINGIHCDCGGGKAYQAERV